MTLVQLLAQLTGVFVKCLADLFYTMMVPEEEKHDSAVKRKNEALVAELKLWEGYLKVPLQQSEPADGCDGFFCT